MQSISSARPLVNANRPARKPQERTATVLRSPGHVTLNLTEWFVRTARSTLYHLRAVPVDFGQAGFELVKFSCEKDPGTYHVHLDAQLGHSCDCKGFLRWGHCKHVDALAELFRRGVVKAAPRD